MGACPEANRSTDVTICDSPWCTLSLLFWPSFRDIRHPGRQFSCGPAGAPLLDPYQSLAKSSSDRGLAPPGVGRLHFSSVMSNLKVHLTGKVPCNIHSCLELWRTWNSQLKSTLPGDLRFCSVLLKHHSKSVTNIPRYEDPLGEHRTYVKLLAMPVGSLTSDRCVSPARANRFLTWLPNHY